MEKINKLRKILIREKIDGYIIPKNDEFFGEYVSNHNDRLFYITNFSGSSGFAVILKTKNYLFVDGRYTLQAENQSGKFFKIFTFPKKMPRDILKSSRISIGFDPKLFTKKTLSIFFKGKYKLIPLRKNFVDEIWKRRKKINRSKFYHLPKNSVGLNFRSKIDKLVKNLKKKNIDYQFITACENNAWLLNIRGSDSKYTPIPNGYILIDKNYNLKFFCDLKKITNSLEKNFKNIEFINLELTEKILSNIKDKKFLIDKNTCSLYFENLILKNNKILELNDPIYDFKAIKSHLEIENIKSAHIHDGIALTKYLFWIKKNFLQKKITEMSGSEKLLQFRKRNKKFKNLSFPTISGTGPNAAIIHYKPSRKTNRTLKKGDIYLVDSGGQYEFGTTDVTRTISLQNTDQRIKNIFTRILKGHIAVSNFNLKMNSTGSKIDFVARKFLKNIGLNYSHGTGHGVGYYLNVHEGPHSISPKNKIKFQEGMVVSNEPGYYEKNNFGIRIENLIYVKKTKKRNYFENLTMAPIDKDLINIHLLNSHEKDWLNRYHKKVFLNLKKAMNKTEFLQLKKACSAI